MARLGLFIAGTDTGVGKTWITGALARALRDRRLDVGVGKPVQSGGLPGQVDADSYQLRHVSGVADSETDICPRSYPTPLTPWLAAHLAGETLRLPDLVAGMDPLFARHEAVLIEGAGGLGAPLTATHLGVDLAVALGLPVLLVARPGLGTVSHTLMSVQWARQRGLTVVGVLFNGYRGPLPPLVGDLAHIGPREPFFSSEATNPFLVSHFGQVPILGRVPWLAEPTTPANRALHLAAHIDLPALIDLLNPPA